MGDRANNEARHLVSEEETHDEIHEATILGMGLRVTENPSSAQTGVDEELKKTKGGRSEGDLLLAVVLEGDNEAVNNMQRRNGEKKHREERQKRKAEMKRRKESEC